MTEAAASSFDLSLVLTTVGRPAALSRFLDGLEIALKALGPDVAVELVLIDQGADRACTRIVTERDLPVACQLLTSPPGAATGRAAGVAVARGELIAIPNDNCWYEGDTLSRVLAAFAGPAAPTVLSGRLSTADGNPSQLRWHRTAGAITRTNWLRREIASTLFFRREPVVAVGSFDVTIGAGSAGRAQAGEESDLVLRLLGAGYRAHYDPSISVHQDEPRDAPTRAFITKMSGYGFGQGRLWRVHRLPLWLMGWLILRKLVAAGLHLLRREWILTQADLAFVRGWVVGYCIRQTYPVRAQT
jgi:hypothetical protein